MSLPLRDRLLRGLKYALLTALSGLGISVLLLAALFIRVSWGPVLLTVGAVSLAFCLLHALSPKAAALAGLIGFVLVILGCFNLGPLAAPAQSLRVFWIYSDLLSVALPPYRGTLSILLPALITGLCAFLVLIDLPVLTLQLMALLSIVFGAQMFGNATLTVLIGAGCCVAAVLLALAHERTRLTAWPLAIAAAALLLALLLVPRTPPAAPRLKQAAEDLYQTLADYLPSSDESARAGFTLETEGYLPLGSDAHSRLGGAADPTSHPVMQVLTDYTLYLRGVTMNHYNGLNWFDTLSARRYLYADLLQQAYRRQVFNEYLPLTSGPLELRRASVTMSSAAATTLYVPQRLRSLTAQSAHMTPYFNAASELFLPRELREGDSYAFTYLALPADSEDTARMVEEASAVADAQYAEIAAVYTALPSHMQGELYALSYQAARGEETPYRRALAIRDYLREHYTYTLNVSTPPDNVDFAAWFLLREREGYCTYFATALTLLCRMQGIPARYVTGYLVSPVDGVANVTSMDAHAWTEVYLNGFGWLTLDATPGEHRDGDSGSRTPDDNPPSVSTPTPEPTPTPTPMPTPTPEAGEEPDAAPTPTPTPPPVPGQTETPAGEPPTDARTPWGWILFFVILALIALFLLLCLWLDPARRAQRQPRKAAEILMAADEAALAVLFRRRQAGETLIDYYAAAEARWPELPLTDLARAYSARLYGRKPMRAELPLRVWQTLEQRLSLLQRIRIRFCPIRH